MYSTCASLKHMNISVFIYIYMLQIEIWSSGGGEVESRVLQDGVLNLWNSMLSLGRSRHKFINIVGLSADVVENCLV